MISRARTLRLLALALVLGLLWGPLAGLAGLERGAAVAGAVALGLFAFLVVATGP